MNRFLLLLTPLVATLACAHASSRGASLTTLSAPVQRVRVTTSSGEIRVAGKDRHDVQLSMGIVARAPTEKRAREMVAQIAAAPPIDHQGETWAVGDLGKYGFGPFENARIDFNLEVPRSVSVELESSSGGVQVSGIAGPVKASASSGEVRVSGIERKVEVETSSGEVTLIDLGGDLQASTSSGDLKISSALGQRSRWELDHSSGDVQLALPKASSFALRVSTSSGSIETKLPVQVRGEVSRTELDGVVGPAPGDRSIDVSTSSGGVVLLTR